MLYIRSYTKHCILHCRWTICMDFLSFYGKGMGEAFVREAP